jgi:hypothetical protein
MRFLADRFEICHPIAISVIQRIQPSNVTRYSWSLSVTHSENAAVPRPAQGDIPVSLFLSVRDTGHTVLQLLATPTIGNLERNYLLLKFCQPIHGLSSVRFRKLAGLISQQTDRLSHRSSSFHHLDSRNINTSSTDQGHSNQGQGRIVGCLLRLLMVVV